MLIRNHSHGKLIPLYTVAVCLQTDLVTAYRIVHSLDRVYLFRAPTLCVPYFAPPHFAPHTMRPPPHALLPIVCAQHFAPHILYAYTLRPRTEIYRKYSIQSTLSTLDIVDIDLHYFYRLCMHCSSKISVMELILINKQTAKFFEFDRIQIF